MHKMDINWGIIGVWGRFCTAGEPPADSRGPTGRFPPHAEARTSHVAHAAGFAPRMHRRPALPPREAGRATGGAFSCMGTLAAHPHPRAHASPPGLLAYVRGPALADGLAAQGAARIHCQTRDAQHLGPPRPRLRRGRYDRPACHFTSPERPPPAGTEEPATRGGLGMRARKAGAGSCLPYFAAAWRRATLAFMHSTTPTARTPTIAVTQAAKSPKCRAGIPMSRPTT